MVANVVQAASIQGSAKSWHGLETTLTPEEARDLTIVCERGGLKTVSKVPLVGMRVEDDGTSQMFPTEHCGIYTVEDSPILLGVHTNAYHVHQAFDVLSPYHEAILADGRMHWDFVASLKGGRVFTACAVLEEDQEIVSETHKSYLFATSSFDGSLNTHLGASCVRIVCENTLRAAFQAKDTKKLKYKHRSALPGMNQIQADIENALGQIDMYKAFAEQLALHRMAKDAAIEFLRSTIFTPKLETKKDSEGNEVKIWTEPGTRQKNRMEALERSFETTLNEIGSNVTAWTVFNSVTRFADHEQGIRKTEKREGISDNVIRFENNLLQGGSSDRFKQEQVSKLVELIAA